MLSHVLPSTLDPQLGDLHNREARLLLREQQQ